MQLCLWRGGGGGSDASERQNSSARRQNCIIACTSAAVLLLPRRCCPDEHVRMPNQAGTSPDVAAIEASRKRWCRRKTVTTRAEIVSTSATAGHVAATIETRNRFWRSNIGFLADG